MSKNLRRSADVASKVLVRQAQLLQQDAGPIRPEAAAVEPDVEQPVVFVVRFFRRGVEQELAGRILPLEANLDLQCPDLIEPQRGHASSDDGRQRLQKLSIRDRSKRRSAALLRGTRRLRALCEFA